MTDKKAALSAALAQIDRAFGKDGTGEPPALPKTMTERVGRALAAEEGYAYDPEPYDARARAVFAAMGSPTEEMLNDAEGWQPKDAYQDLETAREQIEFLWQAMLDCAEAELSEETLARKARDAEFDKLSPDEKAARWAKWETEHGPAF